MLTFNEYIMEKSETLEVPDDGNVEDLPVSHFKDLIDRKGRKEIIRALTNLEVWFKYKKPELSNWAIGMKKSLEGYGEKEDEKTKK